MEEMAPILKTGALRRTVVYRLRRGAVMAYLTIYFKKGILIKNKSKSVSGRGAIPHWR